MKVSWRTIGTVLLEEELLDKAFSRAKKAADRRTAAEGRSEMRMSGWIPAQT